MFVFEWYTKTLIPELVNKKTVRQILESGTLDDRGILSGQFTYVSDVSVGSTGRLGYVFTYEKQLTAIIH